jgi:hypothetical protein
MPRATLQAETAYAFPELHFFIQLSCRLPQSTVLYVNVLSVFDVFSTRYWQLYELFVF